ncbi:transposase [Streptomyces sp. YIM S03343]
MGTKYVGDILYLPPADVEFRCLATVIDLCSRRLAGWAIAGHLRADLVVDALKAAGRTRGSLASAVMHTDHGAQYCSPAFADACRWADVAQPMSAIGSSADNAPAESFNATCKTRDPPGPQGLEQRARGPPGSLTPTPPLQHRPTPLPPRTPQPHRLRKRTSVSKGAWPAH